MKQKTLSMIFLFLWLFEAVSFAGSIEITTGSGNMEGIRDVKGRWLKDGCLVQIIKAKDGIIHEPSQVGKATVTIDEVIATTEVGNNFPFNRDTGKFDTQAWVSEGDKIYVGVWNASDPINATEYGVSGVYSARGFDGEVWNINGKKNIPALILSKMRNK